MLSAADLPNDIEALKAMLMLRDQQITGLKAQVRAGTAEIEHLKLMIAKLRRMQFGRKSEKLDHQIEQLELQLEDLQADEAEAAREMPAVDQAPRKKSVRRPLPEHLPRDDKVYLPECESRGSGLTNLHKLAQPRCRRSTSQPNPSMFVRPAPQPAGTHVCETFPPAQLLIDHHNPRLLAGRHGIGRKLYEQRRMVAMLIRKASHESWHETTA